jgi:hypothetical protein
MYWRRFKVMEIATVNNPQKSGITAGTVLNRQIINVRKYKPLQIPAGMKWEIKLINQLLAQEEKRNREEMLISINK